MTRKLRQGRRFIGAQKRHDRVCRIETLHERTYQRISMNCASRDATQRFYALEQLCRHTPVFSNDPRFEALNHFTDFNLAPSPRLRRVP